MSATLKRSARGDINQLPCVFSVALGQRCAVCSLALHDAEQLLCTQPLARATCASLHGALRDKARFALGMRNPPLSSLPGAADEMRLQCGGLVGLREQLDPQAHSTDVQRLLERLQDDGLDRLSWEPLLRTIGRWPEGR
jgi:hypothetical protein